MSTLDLTMDTSNCSQDERYQRIQHVFSSTLPPGEKLDTVSPLLDEWFKQEHARPWMEKQGRPSKTMLLELRDNLAHLMGTVLLSLPVPTWLLKKFLVAERPIGNWVWPTWTAGKG